MGGRRAAISAAVDEKEDVVAVAVLLHRHVTAMTTMESGVEDDDDTPASRCLEALFHALEEIKAFMFIMIDAEVCQSPRHCPNIKTVVVQTVLSRMSLGGNSPRKNAHVKH